MLNGLLESDCWGRALTIAERAKAMKGRTEAPAGGNGGLQWLERWKSQQPFDQTEFFERMLQRAGLSEKRFGEILDFVPGQFIQQPDWLKDLGVAYSIAPSEHPAAKTNEERFLLPIKPLIDWAEERLRGGIAALPVDADRTVSLLAANLRFSLVQMISRSLVVELNVARLREELPGDTPEQRYVEFMSRFAHSERGLAFLAEYPVLARQLVVYLNRWVTFHTELLNHFCADFEAFTAQLGITPSLADLVKIESGAGDTHRGGRSVVIFGFRSGEHVVYKPRSCALDQHFQHLTGWLNEHGANPPFRSLNVLDRGDHGWIEYVNPGTCDTRFEVAQYYRRLGGLLAVLYVLDATDMHSENVIASASQPVVVDLETLFHPRIDNVDRFEKQSLGSEALANSVMRVGLLPARTWFNGDGDGVDLSAVGGWGGQLSSLPVPYWENLGTDQMRMERKRVPVPPSQNRPTLRGAEINALDYVEEMVDGFDGIYRLIHHYRSEFAAGPLEEFRHDETRAVLRATRNYALLLNESYHSDFLQEGLERDLFFDRLWVETQHRPHLAGLIDAELADLHAGDIPIFTGQAGSPDLHTSSGALLPQLADCSGIESVRQRLAALNEEDLTRQQWFIRASLATLVNNSDHRNNASRIRTREEVERHSPEDFVSQASAIGSRLAGLALCKGDEVSWIGLSLGDPRAGFVAPLGMDLYDGLPGVALFLSYLAEVTQNGRIEEIARKVIGMVCRYIKKEHERDLCIGAYAGWGGVIYLLTHWASLWKDERVLDRLNPVLEFLPDLIDEDSDFDALSGAAGCALALIGLDRFRRSARLKALILQCGERLIAGARSCDAGVGWCVRGGGEVPLTGFAHGASGIAAALFEIAAYTGDLRFQQYAIDALAYERSHFHPEAGNWTDLRPGTSGQLHRVSTESVYGTAWCSGAPGIGLARALASKHIPDSNLISEMNIAAATTRKQGFGLNHSLCHGDLGNIELLLRSNAHREAAARISSGILDSIAAEGCVCGNPLGVESPGLMTGLAGIGLQLLRIAYPDRIPSVLTLDPPVAPRRSAHRSHSPHEALACA